LMTEPPDGEIRHVVNVSGGKDSTATLLVALETVDRSLIRPLFCDTGNEHPLTYEYVDYLADALDITIEHRRNDFADRINRKREMLAEKWGKKGVSQERIDKALKLLHPTGNPFLDLCMYRASFPSMRRRFCTDELKVAPANRYMLELLDDDGTSLLWNWIGVRAGESTSRRKLITECPFGYFAERTAEDIIVYRPILKWTTDSVFEAHRYYGVKHNPLYEQGMKRVGCMPCVNVSKKELLQISRRFPEEIARIAEWEKLVCEVTKSGAATFLPAVNLDRSGALTGTQYFDAGKIDRQVDWAKTEHGGKQYSLFQHETVSCDSHYGLCE